MLEEAHSANTSLCQCNMSFDLFLCQSIWIPCQEGLVKYPLCDRHMLKGRGGKSCDMVFIIRESLHKLRILQIPVVLLQRVGQVLLPHKPHASYHYQGR